EGGWTKAIFRKAIEGMVPSQIQYRRDKKGFSVPEDRWMREVFRPHATEMFGSTMMAESLRLISSTQLRKAYAKFVAGRGYLNGRHFFRVYAFEAFLRRFADHIAAWVGPVISVVSYGVGNVGSIFSMLRKIGAPAVAA